jgi:two-component system sensor histidine kinase UhpB
MLARLPHHIPYLSLHARIVLGNSLIIVIGAVSGTLLTIRLSGEASSFWLIAFFSLAGTVMCIMLNNWIVRRSLQPLNEMHELVSRVAAGQTAVDTHGLEQISPDLNQLSISLNAIVSQLSERNRQLRALSARAIDAQEDERMRIARTLHDDTGQSLTTLILALDRLEQSLPSEPSVTHDKVAEARRLASDALVELRKIIGDLRPTILDDLGFVPAIRWYARKYLEGDGVGVVLQLPAEDLKLPGELATTLYRITQEAINNILRHSQAKVVTISLQVLGTTVCLAIQDNGVGFNPDDLASQGDHPQKLGLLGIRERADLLGGDVRIASSPGRGVLLEICLPLPANEED